VGWCRRYNDVVVTYALGSLREVVRTQAVSCRLCFVFVSSPRTLARCGFFPRQDAPSSPPPPRRPSMPARMRWGWVLPGRRKRGRGRDDCAWTTMNERVGSCARGREGEGAALGVGQEAKSTARAGTVRVVALWGSSCHLCLSAGFSAYAGTRSTRKGERSIGTPAPW
jgi:hypothetical protein